MLLLAAVIFGCAKPLPEYDLPESQSVVKTGPDGFIIEEDTYWEEEVAFIEDYFARRIRLFGCYIDFLTSSAGPVPLESDSPDYFEPDAIDLGSELVFPLCRKGLGLCRGRLWPICLLLDFLPYQERIRRAAAGL